MNVKGRFYKKNLVFAKTIMLKILSLFFRGVALIVAPISSDGPRKKTFMTTVVETVDNLFMREALKSAQLAQELNEVPIGAVLVQAGQIIIVNEQVSYRDRLPHTVPGVDTAEAHRHLAAVG